MEKKHAAAFIRDLAKAREIIEKGTISHDDKMVLLSIYRCSWHDSGKIEGILSLDSSCHGCTFCQKMMELAKQHSDIICGYCYDNKQENRWQAVEDRHGLNLMIMSSVDFSVEELKTLQNTHIVRINSSGDIENAIHAGNMIKYAIAFPAAHVTLWAKNDEAVQEAFSKYGKPKNLIYIASSVRINHRRALPKNADYTFTVYDEDHIQEAIDSGSMPCNGKKCKDCGFHCYLGTWPIGSDIAELLRK